MNHYKKFNIDLRKNALIPTGYIYIYIYKHQKNLIFVKFLKTGCFCFL